MGASCTCHPAGSSIGLVAATNNDECKSNVSTESSQYITPSSSFNTVDNAKEIDSLDCKIGEITQWAIGNLEKILMCFNWNYM